MTGLWSPNLLLPQGEAVQGHFSASTKSLRLNSRWRTTCKQGEAADYSHRFNLSVDYIHRYSNSHYRIHIFIHLFKLGPLIHGLRWIVKLYSFAVTTRNTRLTSHVVFKSLTMCDQQSKRKKKKKPSQEYSIKQESSIFTHLRNLLDSFFWHDKLLQFIYFKKIITD